MNFPSPVPSINDDEVLSGESESTQKRNEEHVTKKRGRPKKQTTIRTWADDETTMLIDVWARYENLYLNRDVRQ